MKNKIFYRKIYIEKYNNSTAYYKSGPLVYGKNPGVDEVRTLYETRDYEVFIKDLKNNKFKTNDYFVKKTLFGKEIVKTSDRWETYTCRKKDFGKFEIIEYYEQYILSYEQLKKELSAEQYIEWCKDNDVAIN